MQLELALIPKSYPTFTRAITRAMPAITRSQELSRDRESYYPFNVRSECAISRSTGSSRKGAITNAVGPSTHSQELSHAHSSYYACNASYHSFPRAITRSRELSPVQCAFRMCYKAVPQDYHAKELSRMQLELALIPKSYPTLTVAITRAMPAITRSQELSRVRESYYPFNVRSECAISRSTWFSRKGAITNAVGASTHSQELSHVHKSYYACNASYHSFPRAITRS
jgi:hypothetical protein